MTTLTFKPKTLGDLDTIIPGLQKLWKTIKKDTKVKVLRPSSVTLTDVVQPVALNDTHTGRRYALDLETLELSEGKHISGGEWAIHKGTNNDAAIAQVPNGKAVVTCEWNAYYRYFSLEIQVGENGLPKQIG